MQTIESRPRGKSKESLNKIYDTYHKSLASDYKKLFRQRYPANQESLDIIKRILDNNELPVSVMLQLLMANDTSQIVKRWALKKTKGSSSRSKVKK